MKRVSILIILSSILLIYSCGKSDKDIYESAKSNIANEEFGAALKEFEEIVNQYPKSEYYKEALLQTGQMYQGHVDKNIPYEESLRKAINTYREYYSKFSTDEKAPQTLFMVGFIQANELVEIDSARVTYTKFVESYPDNEMAESARTELENLGLSADEILAKQMDEKTE